MLSNLQKKAEQYVAFELEKYFGLVDYRKNFHTEDNGHEFVASHLLDCYWSSLHTHAGNSVDLWPLARDQPAQWTWIFICIAFIQTFCSHEDCWLLHFHPSAWHHWCKRHWDSSSYSYYAKRLLIVAFPSYCHLLMLLSTRHYLEMRSKPQRRDGGRGSRTSAICQWCLQFINTSELVMETMMQANSWIMDALDEFEDVLMLGNLSQVKECLLIPLHYHNSQSTIHLINGMAEAEQSQESHQQ